MLHVKSGREASEMIFSPLTSSMHSSFKIVRPRRFNPRSAVFFAVAEPRSPLILPIAEPSSPGRRPEFRPTRPYSTTASSRNRVAAFIRLSIVNIGPAVTA